MSDSEEKLKKRLNDMYGADIFQSILKVHQPIQKVFFKKCEDHCELNDYIFFWREIPGSYCEYELCLAPKKRDHKMFVFE